MTLVRIVAIVIGLFLTAFLGEQTKPFTDLWQPFNFFVGKWEGTGTVTTNVSDDGKKIYSEARLQRKK
jgi:hypothetical protein